MKKLNLLIVMIVLLFLQNVTEAQFPTFTLIDTSIICTIGGSSNSGHWGDFNNDGLEDLIIVNMSETPGSFSHFLFINQGDWLFNRVTEGAIAEYVTTYGSHGACWGDFNNDGYLDLFIGSLSCENNLLFQNNGDGTFTRITDGMIVNDGGDSGPTYWIDVDNDGFLDLYVVNQTEQINALYKNNGGIGFTKVLEGEFSNAQAPLDLGSAWVDIDNDNDLDAYSFGMGRNGREGFQKLLINDGDGNFEINATEIITGLNKVFFGVAWGDYDNDGYQDLFIPANEPWWVPDYDLLFRNSGNGSFEQVTGIPPVNVERQFGGGSWVDLDNNGFLDLVHTDGNSIIYYNNGDGSFIEQTLDFESVGNNFTDINNDGFIDLFVPRGYKNVPPLENLLYANDGNSNSWINIKPVGTVSNKSAIGSRIKVKSTINGSPVWQVRETGLNGSSLNAHFGLGDATIIDSLVVHWPAGHDTVMTDVDVNQFLTITEEIPEGYLRASFAVDTTMGRGELTVQFTDISRFDPASPVTSWSWDFDEDGTEDSDEQNPEYSFTNPEGDIYDIRLVVSNGTDSDTITRKDFIRLHPLKAENLVQWSIATASSVEYPNFNAQYAIDGEMLSRWSSLHTNSEWLKVEMDSVYEIGKVVIHWEAAYARKYEIQTSLDDLQWQTVHCKNAGDGLEDTIKITGTSAKYVRLMCLQRTLVNGYYYGYSVYEIEIYRSDGNEYDDNCGTGIINHTKPDDKISVYPNPFNESVTFSFVLERSADVQLSINDLLGRKIVNVHNGRLDAGQQLIVWERTNIYGKRVNPGYYLYQLIISDNSDDLKLNGTLFIAD